MEHQRRWSADLVWKAFSSYAPFNQIINNYVGITVVSIQKKPSQQFDLLYELEQMWCLGQGSPKSGSKQKTG